MVRPIALSSLGEAPGYATLWIQKFVLKQRIRIAKCLIEQQNGFLKNNWLHFSKQQNYIVILFADPHILCFIIYLIFQV